jgi:hypothetical protein
MAVERSFMSHTKFKVSAKLSSPDRQLLNAWMAEKGIKVSADLAIAVQNYKICSGISASGSAHYGWC